MFTKIKEFLFGKPTQVEVQAPYKVEVVPAGTEASISAAPVAEKPKAPAKPRQPVEPKPKAPAKPRAPKKAAK